MDAKAPIKREDELTDLSKIPSSDIPQEKSHGLFGKVSETLSHGFDKVKGLVGSNKGGAGEKADEIKTEVKEVINEWEQPLGHANRPHAHEAETKAEPAGDKPSLGDRLKEGISGFSGQISQKVDDLKDRFKSKDEGNLDKESTDQSTEASQGGQSFAGKIKDGFGMISSKFSKKPEEKTNDAGGFHEVHDGFSETVDELKHEQGKDQQYVSSNPFEALEGEPTEDQKQGFASKLGGDITNKVQQLKDGFSNTTSMISDKITETKDKIKSSITSGDKENAINIDQENRQISS